MKKERGRIARSFLRHGKVFTFYFTKNNLFLEDSVLSENWGKDLVNKEKFLLIFGEVC